VLVAGDRVIRSRRSDRHAVGELFGVPHSGKSFRIMAVDVQTIRDGRIAKTFHMETGSVRSGSFAPDRRRGPECGRKTGFGANFLT